MNDNTKEVTKKLINNKGLRTGINIVALFFFLQPILVGFAFVLISTITTISDFNNIKGYNKVSAKLDDKTDCETGGKSDIKVCFGIYTYTVNDEEFEIKGNIKTNVLANTLNVYYNPDNPSENYILNNMTFFMVGGLLLVMINILIYISVTKLIGVFLNGANGVIDTIPTYNKN